MDQLCTTPASSQGISGDLNMHFLFSNDKVLPRQSKTTPEGGASFVEYPFSPINGASGSGVTHIGQKPKGHTEKPSNPNEKLIHDLRNVFELLKEAKEG